MKSTLFGKVAQQKGYVTENDVERALKVQRELRQHNHPHKLIGIIMLEMGMISSTQLLDVLKYLDAQKPRYF